MLILSFSEFDPKRTSASDQSVADTA